MLKGIYNLIKNGHAAKAINTRAEIPDVELAVGEGEVMQSIARSLRGAGPAVQAPTIANVRNMDDTAYIGSGAQVTPDQFPVYYYIGEDQVY